MATIGALASAFDAVLGLGLLWLAWRSLACPDLFKAVVLFVSFGLLLALAWVRLDAPDVALAEAAIGAGLTGALLLGALGRLRSAADGDHTTRLGVWRRAVAAVASVLVAGGLGYAVLALPRHAPGLSAEVTANLASSGVSNPVTAVLLNFRGYDTLLEMFVLLTAVLGVWSLGLAAPRETSEPGPVLDTLVRVVTPVLILVAGYLLWVGAHAPGGAFQAGSVLGAAGVLLLLAGFQPRPFLAEWPLRLVLVAGAGAFIAMAVVTFVLEGRLLKFPPSHAGALILLLEAVATLTIGVTLAALFLGGRPRGEDSQ